MIFYWVMFGTWLLSVTVVEVQFHLYYTPSINETELYYDCLYYRVLDNAAVDSVSKNLESPHQLILYCIRPGPNEERQRPSKIKGNISSRFTFTDLSKERVTPQDLLSWSAPVDLVERYQEFLNTPNSSAASDALYNCTPLWFGTSCQYTFDSSALFSEIVNTIFSAKTEYQSVGSVLDITNLTCYVHVECNRGRAPLCLDWREICDGIIDCLRSGIDEIGCFQLEANECEQDEYRCHNGMCIPEQFFNDDFFNPDCLDATDENDDKDRIHRYTRGSECYKDPAFRCEESNPFSSQANFASGDGQRRNIGLRERIESTTLRYLQCRNYRDTLVLESALLDTEYSNMTKECWALMNCITLRRPDVTCKYFCESQVYPCHLSIASKCNHSGYVIFPIVPILQGHVKSGYWANKTIIHRSPEYIILPHFVCYSTRRCPFLTPDFMMDDLTCLTIESNGSKSFNQLIWLFHTCLSVDQTENEISCSHPSMFHCPNTSKCISKHRLLDGIEDCYGGADETYIGSCKLNDSHRFRCSSEEKCLSPVLLRDDQEHCLGGADEIPTVEQKLSFQKLCNGYTHFAPVLIDNQNKTDETNCEQWPCSNQYTRCDGAWTCSNGADELNCDENSKCYPDRHECVSPTTFQVECLPLNRAGDGRVDCLGATDERKHCRDVNPELPWMRYRCWNQTTCISDDCLEMCVCPFESAFSITEACSNNPEMASVIRSLNGDIGLGTEWGETLDNFELHPSARFPSHTTKGTRKAWIPKPTIPISTAHSSDDRIGSPWSKQINFHQAWICNRGIPIFIGPDRVIHCLCPPSYYGDRCQFQSQRVSLTLKFSRECAVGCRGVYAIVLSLVDDDQVIHSAEQLTYISTVNCDMRYNVNFLYRSRPKNLSKEYTIRLHIYDKMDLAYYTSAKLSIKLLFLPVNRIAAHVNIPAHAVHVLPSCGLMCGCHGHCATYMNTGDHFCRCIPGWSGFDCTIDLKQCDCAAGSVFLDIVNNRSICLCSLRKSGPRCFLHSVCHENPCKNGGLCVPDEEQLSESTFACICTVGYSGRVCEVQDTRIDFSFHDVDIPQSLLIHFITIQNSNRLLRTTVSKKIAFHQDTVTVYTPVLFNLIFAQVRERYYLAFLQINTSTLAHVGLEIKSIHHCASMHNLLDKEKLALPLLRRAKYYHVPCRERSELSCLYDVEGFLCVCNKDGYANCFPFNFKASSSCRGRTQCENGGQCVQDLPTCPTSTMCVCSECFYGGKCQFTTKGYSLSLDAILGYQMGPHVPIIHQPLVVKMSLSITTLMSVIGLINGIISTTTFRSKKLEESGCRLYLFALSIVSLFTIVMFNGKFWLLFLTQTSWLTNRTFLLINCIFTEYILQALLTFGDWLSASVAIDRAMTVIKGVHFSQKKSKRTARWIILVVMLVALAGTVHDPIHRRLIDDDEEKRTWCIVQYSSAMKVFDSVTRILHFVMPFSINLISAIVIIVTIARTHSTTRKTRTYKQHLKKQCKQQKHLIISPIILVVLAEPRLIISFLFGCMKSVRDPWLFLFGYIISFIPALLTSVVFILPSETYKEEFNTIVARRRTAFLRYLHLK